MPKRLTPRGEAAPPVEPIITGATLPARDGAKHEEQARPAPSAPGIMYVRNLHHIQARVTLANKRVISLEPRGQREDLDIVNVDEQQDPKFLANKDLLFEVISPEDAKAIIYKQQHNSRQEHPAWTHLRNEQGKAYDQRATTIEEIFEQQGVKVGEVTETGAGRFTDRNHEVVRTAGQNVTSVPGSPGHPATEFMNSVPSAIEPDEYHEFLLWKQFKQQQKEAGNGPAGS